MCFCLFFFFFQAEDGIRDWSVTGVQTCALPISPRHPYTRALLDSIPKLGTKEPLYAVPGQPPDLSNLPSGCSFHPRCRYTMAHCRDEEPPEQRDDNGGTRRCWLTATPELVY